MCEVSYCSNMSALSTWSCYHGDVNYYKASLCTSSGFHLCLKIQSPSRGASTPQTKRTRNNWRTLPPKNFQACRRRKKIFIRVISIHLEMTAQTKRYWFRGHGLKNNSAILFITFAVLSVSRHMVDAAWVYSFVKLKPLMVRPHL